jgi:hypothetical protein
MKDRRRASRESMAWTLAFGQPEDRTPTHWLRADARGRDGGVHKKLAAYNDEGEIFDEVFCHSYRCCPGAMLDY